MRLLVDVMCGGVVAYLRMCGHDTLYAGDHDLEADEEILALARADERTIVTRDTELATRADDAVLLTTLDTEDQLEELLRAGVELELSAEPTRCGVCNGRLGRVDRHEQTPDYAPDPEETTRWTCRDCGQYFWRGSHWDRVRETIDEVRMTVQDQ